MKYTITREMVIEAAIRSKEQGRCVKNEDCVYSDGRGGHCVVGHALVLAGVPVRGLRSDRDIGFATEAMATVGAQAESPKVHQALENLQRLHDSDRMCRYPIELRLSLGATDDEVARLTDYEALKDLPTELV